MIVEQRLQLVALLAIHRDQVVDRILDHRLVAEDQSGRQRHRHTNGAKRIGVAGDLQ